MIEDDDPFIEIFADKPVPFETKMGRANGRDHYPGWPPLDRELLNNDRLPAPPLIPEAIPQGWFDWICATAQDCGAPPDYVAANLIGAASSVIGNVRRVSPWEGWIEQPHLWIATVGHPSTGKTPSLAPFRTACVTIEHALQPAHEAAMIALQTKKAGAEAAERAWKDDVRKAAKNGEPTPQLPQDAIAPDQPIPPRLLIADASTEEAQSLLAGNPRGLALVRSELAAWFGQFDRYGGTGADRGFYLECWDGGPHTVDRVKFQGKVLRVPYASLAIIGSIQPDKLAEVFAGADDGLTSRFLYIFPEAIPPRPRETTGANERAGVLLRAFTRLRSLDWDHQHNAKPIPLLMRIDQGGLDILQATRQKAFEATGQGLMTTWLGKNSGRLLRLALVFELLEWASNDAPQPCEISTAAVQRAAAYLQYCAAMMERVIGNLARTQAQRDAEDLARIIVTTRATTLNEREVYRSHGCHHLRDPARRKAAFAELQAAGWIRRSTAQTAGRPPGDWETHPTTHRGG